MRREVIAAQPRREVIVQRRTRPVIVEQQPIIIRRGGIRKRAILNDSNVFVVRNAVRFFNYVQKRFVFKTMTIFYGLRKSFDHS